MVCNPGSTRTSNVGVEEEEVPHIVALEEQLFRDTIWAWNYTHSVTEMVK